MVQFIDRDGAPGLPRPLRVVLVMFLIAVALFAIALAIR